MLRHDLLPVVPSQGRWVHLVIAPSPTHALPVIGEGTVACPGVETPAADALRKVGLAPLVLEPKEGLSLLNGTEGMLAMLVLALDRAQRLVRIADLAAALSIEALLPVASGRSPGRFTRCARIQDRSNRLVGSSRRSPEAPSLPVTATTSTTRCRMPTPCVAHPRLHGAAADVLTFADEVAGPRTRIDGRQPIVFP